MESRDRRRDRSAARRDSADPQPIKPSRLLGIVAITAGGLSTQHGSTQRDRHRRHRQRVHRHRPHRGPAPDRRPRARPARLARRSAARPGRRRPRRRARPTPRSTSCSPTTGVARRPRHLAQRAPLPAGQGDPRGGPARRVREAAGDDRRRSRPSSSGSPRRAASSTRSTSTSASTRSTSTCRELVRDGGLGDVRLVTGRYFQDWLLHDTDWNWRLEPDQGGALRAVGDIGSHWLDLTTFLTGLRVPSVMADLTTFIPVRHQPTGPVETFSTERAAETVGRRDRHRGRRDDPAPLRGRGPRAVAVSQLSAGPQEQPPVRDRRLLLRRGVGLGAARAAVDRSPRPAERAPAPQPRADERARRPGGARCRAATSRASPTRSARCSSAIYDDVLAGRPAAQPALRDVRRRPRRDARRRRDRRERPTGTWVDVARDEVAATPRRFSAMTAFATATPGGLPR